MFKVIIKFILGLFFRVEIKGLENWRKAGSGVLIAPNYISAIDPLILALFLPEKTPLAVDKRFAEKPSVKPFLSMLNAHVLDSESPFSVKFFLSLLKEGGRCIMFPEIKPTITGNVMKLSPSVAAIAEKTNAKILPVHIQGTQNTPFSSLPHKHAVRFFSKVTITIMPVKTLDVPKNLSGSKRSAASVRELEKIMNEAAMYARRKEKPFWDILLDARREFGGSAPIFGDCPSKPVSYNGFITRILLLEKALISCSVKGDNVGVLMPTSLAGVTTMYAIQKMGRVPAMLNFSQGGRSLVNCCRSACVKTVITSRKFIALGKLEALMKALQDEGLHIVFLEDAALRITSCKKILAALCVPFLKPRSDAFQNAAKPAVVVFTSGSEGAPKGVVLSYKNLNTNHAQMFTRIDFSRSDVILNCMPMFHSFGLCGIFMPVTLGILVYLYPSPLHYKTIAALCYDKDITFVFATDTFLAGYAKAASDNFDFASMRILVQGGEKLKPSTQETWFSRFNVRITEGYGVTECSPVVSNNYYAHHKKNTVGLLVPGLEHKIVPVEGVSEGGRLWLKGDNIMLGYLRITNPGVLEPPKDGWYDTGDIVSIDEEGYITILGRAKRFAKIGGEMISLASVEEVLNECWPENSHAAVMLHSKTRGETLALVTTRASLKRDELRKKLAECEIAEIAIPKKIIIREEIPLLATGKVDYVMLEEIMTGYEDDDEGEEATS